MQLSYGANVGLGVAFVAVGLVATALQLWLWTFPMAPDPHGRDPNGVTTAPRAWRMVHRALGYVFVAVYIVLMAQMVPRLWQYDGEAWGAIEIAHAALGTLVGVVLVIKVAVLRKWQRFGKKMRPLGLSIFAFAVLAVAIGARPAYSLPVPTDPTLRTARQTVIENCRSCHGLSQVLREDGDRRDWSELLEEMAENAQERGRPDPSLGQRREIAAYLAWALGERDDDDD
jgi:hypothetical protein